MCELPNGSCARARAKRMVDKWTHFIRGLVFCGVYGECRSFEVSLLLYGARYGRILMLRNTLGGDRMSMAPKDQKQKAQSGETEVK